MGQGGSRKMIQDDFETIKGDMIAQTIVIMVKFWINLEVQPMGIAGGLDMVCERNNGVKDYS